MGFIQGKKFFVALCIAVFAVSFIVVLYKNGEYGDDGTYTWIVNQDTKVLLEPAITREEKTRGLSGRESLSLEEGMFFIYSTPQQYSFWMKDMLFSIDIIWLDEEFRVVNIKHNVSPDTYPTTFVPTQEAQYVVEVQNGFAKSHEVKIGEVLEIVKTDD
tara:strand:+ start:538 stop:1014 length:477 start_codon:yes stop_codon:yes gene_type:complete